MRIIHSAPTIAGIDIDWSLKATPGRSRGLLVVCCSILVSHTAEPPRRAWPDRSAAHRMAPRKSAGDLLVKATAWTDPATGSVQGLRVAAEMGEWRKELAIFGDRSWKAGPLGLAASAPEPFESMPITYDRAFGGTDDPRNPTGLGWGTGERGRRLPNIEAMAERVVQPTTRTEPAGFGPLDPFWQRRVRMLGTFDEAWLEQRWPGMPADFDPRFWNAAPPDQQFAAGFRGDEALAFENLHPAQARLALQLPGLRARAFTRSGEDEFVELGMALDTIDVDLDLQQTELVWRGARWVASARLRDIDFLFTLVEPLAEPADPSACRTAFETLRRAEYPTDMEQQADHEAAQARQAAAAAQRDATFAALRQDADSQLAAAKLRVDAVLKQHGLAAPDTTPAPADPPSMRLAAAIESLRKKNPAEAAAFAPSLERLQAIEAASIPWTRERVIAAHAANADMAEARLAGLDLSGLHLEGARLRGANLAGARLVGTTLAAADLTGADLSRADLTDAVLLGTNLAQTRFREARLDGANFGAADLGGAQFTGVGGTRLVFDLAHGEAVDFSGAGLRAASFRHARLPGAIFTGAALDGAAFDGAALPKADFGQVGAQGASFDNAELTNLRAVEANFRDAKFTGCKGAKIVLQQACLADADLSHAVMTGGNFAEAVLDGARLDRASLAGACFDDASLLAAMLTNANLLRASFERSDLTNADLRGSNLYQAGLASARALGANFTGCFVAGSLLA